jgi:hypothetical protein
VPEAVRARSGSSPPALTKPHAGNITPADRREEAKEKKKKSRNVDEEAADNTLGTPAEKTQPALANPTVEPLPAGMSKREGKEGTSI